MPTLSVFYGIVIQMFWRDHNPPHFHALYGEHEAVFDLRDLRVLRGTLTRRAMVLFWNGRPIIETNSWRIGIYAANSNLSSRSIP